jgi:hypothetical protein
MPNLPGAEPLEIRCALNEPNDEPDESGHALLPSFRLVALRGRAP